jgi:hypothetical protein
MFSFTSGGIGRARADFLSRGKRKVTTVFIRKDGMGGGEPFISMSSVG